MRTPTIATSSDVTGKYSQVCAVMRLVDFLLTYFRRYVILRNVWLLRNGNHGGITSGKIKIINIKETKQSEYTIYYCICIFEIITTDFCSKFVFGCAVAKLHVLFGQRRVSGVALSR